MNDDGGLDPVHPDGLPGHNDTDTSTAAAAAVLPRLRDQQVAVFAAIRKAERSGLTAHQIAVETGFPVQGCNSRTNELHKLGLIVDSGLRRVGPYNARVIVWMALVFAIPVQFDHPIPWFYGWPGDTWRRPRKEASHRRSKAVRDVQREKHRSRRANLS
jgi:hypothetical protein